MNIKIFLALSLAGSLSYGVSLSLVGAGERVSGTGTSSALQTNDVVLYRNVGANGIGIDALVTINQVSAGTTLDATRDLGLLNVGGTPDSWADITISFIATGSYVNSTSTGTPLYLNDVTTLVARDIDSGNGDFTEVVGLFSAPGAASFGTSLQNVGFENNTGQPTNGVDYVRVTPDAGPAGPTWANISGVNSASSANDATWTYNSQNISEFRWVIGVTGTDDATNRGFSSIVSFANTSTVPEPSSLILIGLGGIIGLGIRRRQ